MKNSMLLLLFIALVAGCSKPASVKEAPLTRAYRLIDAQDDGSAIEYLEQLLAGDPDNADIKVALASAYAHKAGFKVQRFANLIVDSKKISDISNSFNSGGDTNKELTFKVDDFANNFANLLLEYNKMLIVYSEVPSIKNEDEQFLDQAVLVMDSISQPRQEDAFYRAVLRAIQFKHFLAQDLIGSIGDTHRTGDGCSLDLSVVNTSIVKISHILMGVYDDMALATPSKAKDLTDQKSRLANETFSLTLFVTGMSVADEATNLFIKHMAIEEGFGKLLTCKDGTTN